MDQRFNRVLEELLQSYTTIGGTNFRDGRNLPSKCAIACICHDLLRVLFPGFYDEVLVREAEFPEMLAVAMKDVVRRLGCEICKSLRAQERAAVPEPKSEEMLHDFLEQLLPIRGLLWTDIEAAFEGDPAAQSYEEIILAYPALEAIATQRMAHVFYRQGLPLIPRMMTEWAHSRTGIDIHPGAAIGSHFFIDHGTGVVIGESCVIGSHVKLYHGVTLGAKSFQKDEHGKLRKGGKRHPNVEDHVTIYPNSTVLGGDTVIGAGSTIGGNVFLISSVAPNSLVFYEEKQLQVLAKGDAAARKERSLLGAHA